MTIKRKMQHHMYLCKGKGKGLEVVFNLESKFPVINILASGEGLGDINMSYIAVARFR